MFREPIGSFKVESMDIETQEIGNGTMKRRLMLTIFYPLNKENTFVNQEEQVAIPEKSEQYPAIIYSHGIDGDRKESSVLCKDLASSGYIVFCMDHPYGMVYKKKQEKNEIVSWREHIPQDEQPYFSENMKMLLGSLPIRSSKKRKACWESYCSKHQKALRSLNRLWEEDFDEVLHMILQIANGEIKSYLNDKVDLTKGIGGLGASFGGCCIVSKAIKDKRLAYAINLDGALFVDLALTKEHRPPILTLCRLGNYFSTLSLMGAGYEKLNIKKYTGITHWEFTDGIYLSAKGKKNQAWADKKSKERARACLAFIESIYD